MNAQRNLYKKEPPKATLKRCAKCSSTRCCSRECQKADWKAHKKICGKRNSRLEHSMPFTRPDGGTWLHDASEVGVYTLLSMPTIFVLRILILLTVRRWRDTSIMMAILTTDLVYAIS
ncbi:hypothetical protein GGI43DRAFT_409723 [Trichoderma evansii]